jgi:protein SCO1/2
MADQPVEKSSGMNSRLAMLSTVVFVVIGTVVIALAVFNRPQEPAATSPANGSAAIVDGAVFDGVQPVDPPRQLQAFTLTNKDNQPLSLSDLQGKMALILFGYTNCPDVCPGTLLEYKKIKETLGDKADQVAFVFISVDSVRDTPEKIKKYVDGFDPSFIGLTGDEATMRRIGGDYDLYFEHENNPNGAAESYLVTHTSTTYLVDQEGKLVALYVYGTEAKVIAGDIKARLKG